MPFLFRESKMNILEYNKAMTMAHQCRASGDVNSALNHYEIALNNKPQDWNLRFELATLYGSLGIPAKANKHFEVLVKKFNTPMLNANYALSLAELEQYEKAMRILNDAIIKDVQLKHLLFPLAEICRKAGQLDKALVHLEKFLSINSKNSQAWFSMGLIYHAQENLACALECLEKARALDPKNKDYRLHFVRALLVGKMLEEAKIELEYLHENFPASVEVKLLEAKLYEYKKDFIRAIQIYKELVDQDANDMNSQLAYSRLLLRVKRDQEAEAEFKAILLKYPKSIPTCQSLVKLYIDTGRFSEAEKLISEFCKENPDALLIEAMQVEFKTFKLDVELVEKLITQVNSDLKESSMAHYFLAKIYESNHLFDQAYFHFCTSKQLHKSPSDLFYDFTNEEKDFPNRLENVVKNIREKFDMEAIANQSDSPVFVVGMPRSGKSLLSNLLSVHPQLVDLDEIEFSGFESIYKQRENLSGEVIVSVIDEYMCRLEQESNGHTGRLKMNTLPYNFNYIPLILALFPNAKIINMTRNHRDTCLEIFFKKFEAGHAYTYDLENVARMYAVYWQMISRWQELLGDQLLQVKFEDLIQEPQSVFTSVVNFLGVSPDLSHEENQKLQQITSQLRGYKQSIHYADNYKKFLAKADLILDQL